MYNILGEQEQLFHQPLLLAEPKLAGQQNSQCCHITLFGLAFCLMSLVWNMHWAPSFFPEYLTNTLYPLLSSLSGVYLFTCKYANGIEHWK